MRLSRVPVLAILTLALLTAAACQTATPAPAPGPSAQPGIPAKTLPPTPSPATAVPPTTPATATAPQTTAPLPPPPLAVTPAPTPATVIAPDFAETLKSRFGFMPALWDFPAGREAGAAFDRPFFELFQWDMIERERGVFDFFETDRHIKEAQQYGYHVLANIQPFAIWDQAICHGPQPERLPGKDSAQPTRYKPCDTEAYRNFLARLVERYDGDGVDDMPGLTVPVKHWELMNEPEFQTSPIYFQGPGSDYAEVLKITYETVKQADPDALIVQGGMAGMMPESAAWWQGVFDAGGGQYLDIMNMHSIGHGEHLNIPAFRQLLAKNGLQDRPFWVTEVQYQQSHQTQDYTNADFAKILARSYVFALANGADKLFYVNLRMPPRYDAGIPFDERSALVTDDGQQSALFKAHLTVADVLGNLSASDTVQVLKEKVGEWHVDEGQYKFTIGGETVYALWGQGPAPAEITGQVRVVDITGAGQTVDAAALRLTDSPVFVFPE